MRRGLRGLAVGMAIGATAWWAAAGAHRGWTQTKVPVKELDEVTGIEAIRYEDRLVPGIDVLAGGWGLAGAVWVLALVVGRRVESKTDKRERTER